MQFFSFENNAIIYLKESDYMKLAFASDHRGYKLKKALINELEKEKIEIIDCGTFSEESTDYPDYAFKLGELIKEGQAQYGVAICGSGIGISIACNKVKGIRCAHVTNTSEAILSRQHNNANIIALGANGNKVNDLIKIIDLFINTGFKNEERHVRRNSQILEYENK